MPTEMRPGQWCHADCTPSQCNACFMPWKVIATATTSVIFERAEVHASVAAASRRWLPPEMFSRCFFQAREPCPARMSGP
mgnify:CR=1 FL=1